ncbi:response regulator transcription factor [Klebsiella sp. BIGb0407]|uniref:response regulator transcription factor n=1 Tax=Klebsiella sp. BIGb0407 TaxID=2940603 RepID=UPI0021684509|nr:LuxR C-terminal-related transcriptional regulator [Klebsiella sp. BIGb0407]MCS3431595.1 DNA-binding CsgD family transcriptional regulator [Klebsiella sp. BIGb0407]
MRNAINIVLWDENIYLVKAIKIILKEYFFQNDISVTFNAIEDIKYADLVVTTSSSRENDKGICNRIIMFKKTGRGVCYQKELNSGAEIELLENVLDTLYTMPPEEISSDKLNRKSLTLREKQTLQAIEAQLSIKQIAEFLGLSRKTVCAHKYTAMQKLGFERTHALYHWLLQGGLLAEEREGLSPPCSSGRERLTQQRVCNQVYGCTAD